MLDNEDDISLAFDLLIHTAPAGRSRAIDRYAAAAKLQQGTDKALMLEAMRNARFVIFQVKQRHPSTGLIVSDFFRGAELWLVDEGLEKTLPNESLFATRVYKPDQFVMTAGIGIPFDFDLLEDAVCSVPQVTHKMPMEAIDDRRFAEAIYRAALADNVTDSVTFQDPTRNDETLTPP